MIIADIIFKKTTQVGFNKKKSTSYKKKTWQKENREGDIPLPQRLLCVRDVLTFTPFPWVPIPTAAVVAALNLLTGTIGSAVLVVLGTRVQT